MQRGKNLSCFFLIKQLDQYVFSNIFYKTQAILIRFGKPLTGE